MKRFPKIHSMWKRTERGQIIPWEWSRPEFGYLANSEWTWTEKVDGTNIKIGWSPELGNPGYMIEGKGDNSQIPKFLLEKLHEVAGGIDWHAGFGDEAVDGVILYGEGYGAKIQGCGGNYIPDGNDFVLFDVLVEGPERDWWLQRDDVVNVAEKLGLPVVQEVARCSLIEAIERVKVNDWTSAWPGVSEGEGWIGRPSVELYNRLGERITTKVKVVDLR